MTKPRSPSEELSSLLQSALTRLGLSHEAAAQRFGVSQPTVTRWIAKRSVPQRVRLRVIASVLEIDLESLERLALEAEAEQREASSLRHSQAVERALGSERGRKGEAQEDLERRLTDLEARFDQLLSRLPPEIDPPSPP